MIINVDSGSGGAHAEVMSTIDSIMTSPAVTAASDEQLDEVVRRMHDHRVGSVLVTKGPDLVGIVTERDVLRLHSE